MSNEATRVNKKDKQDALVPRLRFPEFWDGDAWKSPQLAELYRFKRTNTLSRDKLNYEGGTVKNIHYGDIHTKFQARFRVSDEYVPYVNPDVPVDSFNDNAFCEEGDIVLADASEDLNDVGKAIEIVSLDGQQVVAGTHTILATRHGVEPVVGFGGYLFQSAVVRAGIQKQAQGAKVYGISANRISTIPVPLPPTASEQQKIADCLGSLDDLISAEGRKLAALRDHKKGLMQQLFPREGETRPRLRFPGFRDAGAWVKQPFEALYAFKPNNTYSRDKLNYDEGSVKNIHYGDIHTRFGTHFHVSEEEVPYVIAEVLPEEPHPEAFCKPGDVIFADASEDLADVGKCIEIIEVGDELVLSGSHTILARPRTSSIAVGFAGYLFKSRCLREGIEREAQGTKVMQISPKRLAKVDVLFPPDENEQQRIADCLSALDATITSQVEKLDALRTHKRGLMQQLFPSPEDVEA